MDLHGYSVPLALAATRYVLRRLQLQAFSEMTAPSASSIEEELTPPTLLIITGRGRGSRGNVPLVRHALLDMLHHAEVMPNNPGRIRVDLARELAEFDDGITKE